MTNADKLLELLNQNFSNVDFVSKEFLEDDCAFIQCPHTDSCLDCPYIKFWKEEYKPLDKE